MQTLWTKIFYQPLYNILILIIASIAFGNLALAVIILTVLVKILLWPLSRKAVLSQMKMKALEPELSKIKTLYPAKEEQAKKTFELYKKNGVNPFSSCLVILIQFPIIIALYYVFYKGFGSPDLLYSFVHMPETMRTTLLGVDITKPSVYFAVAAGISQFFQLHLSPTRQKKQDGEPKNMQEAVARNMQNQMRFVLPVIIAVVSIKLSAAVAIYWITSNIVTIIQERTIKHRKDDPIVVVS